MWIGMNTCCKCDKKLKHVVAKNLYSHGSRNTKTSIMFSIALSFVIFAGCGFEMIGHLIVAEVESFMGADFFITSSASAKYLDE